MLSPDFSFSSSSGAISADEDVGPVVGGAVPKDECKKPLHNFVIGKFWAGDWWEDHTLTSKGAELLEIYQEAPRESKEAFYEWYESRVKEISARGKKLVLEYEWEGEADEYHSVGMTGGGPFVKWLKLREEEVWFCDGADL